MKKKLTKIFSWLDNNILTVLTAILIVVIPLYPKLPLADLITGYIVRLRLEDILIFIAGAVWIIQLIRRKITLPKNTLAKLILLYLVIGTLSSLSAVFITKTVPMERQHLAKLALHLFRRVEYFSLFFIAYTGFKTKRDLTLFVKVAIGTLLAAVLYGFGQKYLYWPAFSTMNREFSKGMRLYLTPTSRVMSTFGGHYDYAAYLMMALTLLVAAFWSSKRYLQKIILFFLGLATYWSLILTASRTSFIGYLAGITVIAYIMGRFRGKLKMFINWFITIILSLTIMLTMGDLSERFFQVLESPDILVHEITRVTPLQRDSLQKFVTGAQEDLLVFKTALLSLKEKLNSPFGIRPKNSISTDELAVAVSSDIPPVPEKPILPPDVTEEEDLIRKAMEASMSGALTPSPSPVSGYSPNALRYGLSVAIRLDALWPRAIQGLQRNYLLGSGYSTLVKVEPNEFTYAESTDNDYLRMLGETGILGTISYLAIILVLCYVSIRLIKQSNQPISLTLGIGTIGVIVSLLVNATYIDVFESSKIAYSLWILAALVIKLLELESKDVKPLKKSR
ncbi:MAG: hypothetical protein ABII80_03685 [bacterium]